MDVELGSKLWLLSPDIVLSRISRLDPWRTPVLTLLKKHVGHTLSMMTIEPRPLSIGSLFTKQTTCGCSRVDEKVNPFTLLFMVAVIVHGE